MKRDSENSFEFQISRINLAVIVYNRRDTVVYIICAILSVALLMVSVSWYLVIQFVDVPIVFLIACIEFVFSALSYTAIFLFLSAGVFKRYRYINYIMRYLLVLASNRCIIIMITNKLLFQLSVSSQAITTSTDLLTETRRKPLDY